jgi:hypothetical protein
LYLPASTYHMPIIASSRSRSSRRDYWSPSNRRRSPRAPHKRRVR